MWDTSGPSGGLKYPTSSASGAAPRITGYVGERRPRLRLSAHAAVRLPGWIQLLCAASIWILLPLTAGLVLTLRGEIKSG